MLQRYAMRRVVCHGRGSECASVPHLRRRRAAVVLVSVGRRYPPCPQHKPQHYSGGLKKPNKCFIPMLKIQVKLDKCKIQLHIQHNNIYLIIKRRQFVIVQSLHNIGWFQYANSKCFCFNDSGFCSVSLISTVDTAAANVNFKPSVV